MFYNHDFLNRRRGGLGIVWLVATLGSRTSLRRVTRKELDTVNIINACHSVMAPPEPVALRLSAQLMYGVIRIYWQKSEQLLADVTAMHATVRKSLSAIGVAIVVGGGDVDMPVPHRHVDSVTLPQNRAPYAGDFDQPFPWDWALQRDATTGDEASMSGISSGARLPASPSPAPSKDRFLAAKDKITLPSRMTDQGLYVDTEEGRGAAAEDRLDADMLDFGLDDGMGLDLGLGDGFEVPPLEGMSTQIAGETAHHPSSSQDGLDPFFGAGEERFDIGDDQGIGLSLEVNPGDQTMPERLQGDVEDSLGEFLSWPEMPTPPVSAARKKSTPFNIEDTRIELTRDEVKALPGLYIQRMEQEQAERGQREYARRAEDLVREKLLFGLPDDIGPGSWLMEFWNVTVGSEMKRLEDGLVEYKKQLAAGEELSIAPTLRGRFAASGLQDIEPRTDFAPNDFMDLDVPPMDESNMPFFAGGPAASESSMDSVGRARGGSIGGPVYPWNVPVIPRDIELSGSLRGDGTPRSHRSLSIGSISVPVLGRPGSLALPSPGRDGETFSGMGKYLQVEDEDRALDTYDSQAAQTEFHKESQNFLQFAKRIAAEVQPEPLFFSDLAPVADSMPTIAAQAFYHVLQLATNGELKVRQDEPYGEILVEVAEPMPGGPE